MKILIDQNDCVMLTEIAQHLKIELDAPLLLYEIESKELAVCAIALGGIQWVETEPQPVPATLAIVEPETEPEDIGRDKDFPPPDYWPAGGRKPLDLADSVKWCEVCGSQIIGRRAQAKTCSVSCAKESNRRKVAERAQTKLREAGTVTADPLA